MKVYHGRLAKFLKTNSYIPTIIRAVDFVAYGILQIRLLFRLRIVSHWVINGHSEPAPPSAPSTELVFGLTLVTNSVENRSHR